MMKICEDERVIRISRSDPHTTKHLSVMQVSLRKKN